MSNEVLDLIKYAHQHGERLPGAKSYRKRELAKGDVPGHEFHGNQYINGGGENGVPPPGYGAYGKGSIGIGDVVHVKGQGYGRVNGWGIDKNKQGLGPLGKPPFLGAKTTHVIVQQGENTAQQRYINVPQEHISEAPAGVGLVPRK